MARIPMTSGFTLIPEGTYVFRVYAATYDEEFGKIEVKLVNAAGMTHTERFSIKDKNDEMNEKALNAFSYFAKTVMRLHIGGHRPCRTGRPLRMCRGCSHQAPLQQRPQQDRHFRQPR